jgi:hypothetical protein
MACYRLNLLGPGGGAERTVEIEADDDVAAIRLAAAQDGRGSMELWCGERKICRFEARTMPAPLPPIVR